MKKNSRKTDEIIAALVEGEGEFVFHPDKLDPSLLITDADDQNYLQSLPELHHKSVLGDHFERIKNAVDMNRAVREVLGKVFWVQNHKGLEV